MFNESTEKLTPASWHQFKRLPPAKYVANNSYTKFYEYN